MKDVKGNWVGEVMGLMADCEGGYECGVSMDIWVWFKRISMCWVSRIVWDGFLNSWYIVNSNRSNAISIYPNTNLPFQSHPIPFQTHHHTLYQQICTNYGILARIFSFFDNSLM